MPSVDERSMKIFEQLKERNQGNYDVFQRLSMCLIMTLLDKKNSVTRSRTPTHVKDETECSFRPQINPISAEIATKGEKSQKPPVWEALYKYHNEKSVAMEEKRKLAEIDRDKQDGECLKFIKYRKLYIQTSVNQ
jgi:hypothetical protein